MGTVSTQVVASFREDAQTGLGGASLQWRTEEAVTLAGSLRLRLYPAVVAKVVASIGTITKLGNHGLSIAREVVQFSGSKTTSTTFPIVNLSSLRKFGATFDRDGNLINPTFKVEAGVITSDLDVYGAVELSYDTSYTLYEYAPQTTNAPGPGGGVLQEFGAVLAFYNGSVATIQTQLPDTESDAFTELYRVVSKVVVTNDGVFEFPPGWTGQPGSPTFPGGAPDPTDANLLEERVQEVGRINPRNTVSTRTFFAPREQTPGSPVYTVIYSMKLATASVNGPITEAILNSPQAQRAIQSARERYNIT